MVVILAVGLVIPATTQSATDLVGRRLERVEWRGGGGISAQAFERWTGWRAGTVLDDSARARLSDGVARAGAEMGYLDARIDSLSFRESAGGLAARIDTHLGTLYRWGRIDLVGARSLVASEAERRLEVRSGEPWSESALARGLARLAQSYESIGRPFTQVRVRSLSPHDGQVDVEVWVQESDTVVVDSVGLEGALRTRPGVVRRALRGIEGAPYQPERALRGRERLAGLGAFSSVSEPRFELSSAGRGVLRYAVVENAGSRFEGVLGYQGENRALAGQGHLVLDNIAGGARRAEASWQGRGQGSSDFRFSYREPFVAGLPVGLGLSLAQALEDTLYTRTDYGMEGDLDLSEGLRLSLGLGGTRVVSGAGEVERSTRQTTWAALTRESSGWRAVADGRETRGTRFRLLTQQDFRHDHLRPEGQDRGHFTTATLEAEGERPWGPRRYVHASLQSGLRLGRDRDFPIYDLFPIGGVQSLRGYREQQFRASRYALLRLDHGWVVGRSRLFLFADQAVIDRAASASDSTSRAGTRYRAGYGFGTWLPTPWGRAGVMFGWGQGDGPLDAKVHVVFQSRL